MSNDPQNEAKKLALLNSIEKSARYASVCLILITIIAVAVTSFAAVKYIETKRAVTELEQSLNSLGQ